MERRMIRPGAAPAAPWRDRDADDEYGCTATPNWRETDWSRELKQIEIDGIPVNYVDVGSGEEEPVVLVHGLGGQWQNWLENIPRLALDRRVVAMDLPGFGLTPEPEDEEISITGYGRCVNALCDELGLGKVELVGNSMGGYVAAEVAIQFPERVSRLVLVSAAGISSAETAPGAHPHRSAASRPRSQPTAPRGTGGWRRARSRATCRSRWWPATRVC